MNTWVRFAIYYRVARLPSQASYAVVAEELSTRPGFLQILSAHQLCISNSAILRNNYISFLICAHAYTWRKNGIAKEAIVLQWAVWIASWHFKLGKKQWAGALLSAKCCCLCENHQESHKFELAHLKKKEKEEKEEEEEEEEEELWNFACRNFASNFWRLCLWYMDNRMITTVGYYVSLGTGSSANLAEVIILLSSFNFGQTWKTSFQTLNNWATCTIMPEYCMQAVLDFAIKPL